VNKLKDKFMSIIKNLLAGLGGAVALNVLHEGLKNKNFEMPRIDLLGEEALQKTLNYFGTGISDPDKLYKATLASDVVSNAIYYSMIGAGGTQNVWTKAVTLGLTAGFGAVNLPEPMGLNPAPVAATDTRKALTVAYYVAGALLTAGILKALDKKNKQY
jgi:hypothetical protein